MSNTDGFRIHPKSFDESYIKSGFIMERLTSGVVTLRRITITNTPASQLSGEFVRSINGDIHLFVFEIPARNKLFEWFPVDEIDPAIIKLRLKDTLRDVDLG